MNDIWQRKPAGLVLGLDFSGGRVTSPEGKTGTLQNGAAISGQTLVLDGVNDFLQIPDSSDLSFTSGGGVDLPFTMLVWYNPTSLQANYNDVVSKGGEYYFRIGISGTAGRVEVACTNTTQTAVISRLSTGAVLTAGQWAFLAATYSGGKTNASLSIYVNGTQVDNFNSGYGSYAGMTNTSNALRIGGSTYSYVHGVLGTTLIFNRVLTAAEMSKYQNAGAARIALGGTP